MDTSIIKEHLTSSGRTAYPPRSTTVWPAQVALYGGMGFINDISAARGNALQQTTIVTSHIDPHQFLARDAEGKHTNHDRILLN